MAVNLIDSNDITISKTGDNIQLEKNFDVPEVVNSNSDSTANAYSCDYVNKLNTYSTTEKRIGTWYDGKPLYEKTIYISALPNASGTYYQHNVSNPDVMFIKNAFWVQTSGATGTIPMFNSSSEYTFTFINKSSGIYIYAQANYSNRSAYVTIQYTKTTD